MSDWLGSHWRWRGTMFVVAISLLGYGWWQAGRWVSRLLVHYSSSPAVYRVLHRDGRQSLEAFDWKTGRSLKLANLGRERQQGEIEGSMRVSPDGKTVVWLRGSQVHSVGIESPDRRYACELPISLTGYDFVGVSRDARFGVFQAVGGKTTLPDGKTSVNVVTRRIDARERVYVLKVVDLETGKVVSSREWQSSMDDGHKSGANEFRSYLQVELPADRSEPQFGRWMLTDKGKWELIEKVKQRFDAQRVWMAQERPGQWKIINGPTSGTIICERVIRPSDSGTRFVTYANSSVDAILVGDFTTGQVREVLPSLDGVTSAFLTSDGENYVISDRRDDIVVFDTATGKVVARDWSGSSCRLQLLGIGVGLLALAAVWTRIGAAESSSRWGVTDALAAILLVQAATFPIYASLDVDDWKPFAIDLFKVLPAGWLHGAFIGSAILTGWYWAHGREWFPARWVLGTLWLTALAVPVTVYNRRAEASYDLMMLQAIVVAGLVTAGAAAALAVLTRSLGWSIRGPVEPQASWRFGLLHLLVLTAAVGFAIVLLQSVLDFPGLSLLSASSFPSGACFLGVPLVGVLFLRPRWAIALGVLVSVAIAVAGSFWFVEQFDSSFPLKKPDRYVGEVVAAVSAMLAIVMSCVVLRGHGWRWAHARKAENVAEATA